ncbi:hypothetical protein Dimus_004812 [Dionaea muscipula]
MVSDSINASISCASKDFGKKKRANRTAKLKQCKLDARREQWLSQVKHKGGKEAREDIGGGCGGVQVPGAEMRNKESPRFKGLDVRRLNEEEEEVDGFVQHGSDNESSAYSPTSGTGTGNRFTGSGSSSSSSCSFRSGRGSSSGSFSEEEEGGEDDGCLDDWEAIADALAAASDDKKPQNGGKNSTEEKHMTGQLENSCELSNGGNMSKREEKKSETLGIATIGVVNNRAWRPDDAFRPQSLPNLSKQRSLPMSSEKHCPSRMIPWGCTSVVYVPTSCPICYEDLDFTDSSFLPCLCGFRLCLFCHKRILEEDGRCPGCRKPYDSNPVEKEASASGGSPTIRFARSYSMFSRS